MTPFIRDDFAGPGGWSEGLRLLGLQDNGIEFDWAAVHTARAAGHRRWLVDVRSDACRNYPWPPIWLYIASPPCQTFSMAGKGSGRDHIAHLVKALHLVAGGALPEDAIREVADEALDERSVLVLEPMLVIRRHGPANVAMEQVPPVLPIWEAYAEILRGWGYSAWTGILHSEQYGVPQTRRRAVLMASREREVAPPAPTHSRYHSHTPDRLDEGLLPWVSMAQALGVASSLRSNYGTSGNPENRGEREATEPAPTMTGKAGRNFWVLQGNQKPNGVDYQQRSIENPAQTITGEAGSFLFVQDEGSRHVTVEEAGVLQSFPADYPWVGNKGKRFEQVGNAVPPLMAAHIVAAVLGLDPTSPRPG